jgi:D-alanyl-D-alanine carboxypeptidase
MGKGSAGSSARPALTVARRCDTPLLRILSALPVLVLTVLICLPAAAAPRYASIVIDASSGKVLQATNPDAVTYPASLTKMMTLYLLFERLGKGTMTLDQTLTASMAAAAQPATNLNLDAGDTITVDTAIRAIIVRSANDVATIIAEAIGGSEDAFAVLMTQKARTLGMNSTLFRNASGLPDGGQVSTARDMALLSRALVRDFPQYYPYFAITRFTYAGRSYFGHNRLMLRYAGADGLKTGYIRASGYNLATSAQRDGRRLIGVVMGGDSAADRDRRMERLLDGAFGQNPAAPAAVQVAVAEPAPAPAPTPTPTVLKMSKKTRALLRVIPGVRPAIAAQEIQVAALAKPAARTDIALPILEKPRFDAVALAKGEASGEPAAAAVVAAVAEAKGPPADAAAPPAALEAPPVVVETPAAETAKVQLASAETTAVDAAPDPAAGTEAPEPAAGAATPAVVQVPPAPLGRSAGSMWTLQVGAFGRFAAAHAAVTDASRAAPHQLRDAEIKIEEALKGDEKIYRAQFVGLSEQTAKAACKGLKAKDMTCIVLSPRVAIAEAAQ